jgi:type III restriction enzyme
VLFQAEPKSRDDATTFEKIKRHLMDDLNIPEAQIKIKTANINELKGVDLMSKDCPVRYIITINALKEGWDCPFAYVLATLANKSSVVDVTQILGRVLRNPHVRRHEVDYLNCSFVFTASSKFNETLTQVIMGLNKAGFSERDYREVDTTVLDVTPPESPQQVDWVKPPEGGDANNVAIELDVGRLNPNWQAEAAQELAHEGVGGVESGGDVVLQKALEVAQEYELQAAQTVEIECPIELEGKMNVQKMMPIYTDFARTLALPQFFQKVVTGGFFDDGDDWQQLSRNDLLSGFELANLDATVSFDDVHVAMRRVDLKETEKGLVN